MIDTFVKIVTHELMRRSYDNTPAGAPGRLDTSFEVLGKDSNYKFIDAKPATEEQILRAHTQHVIDQVRHESEVWHHQLYDMALLAAGGAIQTAMIGARGEPAFGLIRPPGHHASRDSFWGFCYFNNIAVSLLELRVHGLKNPEFPQISSAFILDFDLHEGDGNIDILSPDRRFIIYNPRGHGDEEYLKDVKLALDISIDVDIIVASAGFDQYKHDWGSNLSTEAFYEIGHLMYEFAMERCDGRRYALLEGGYNHDDLGKNVHAFCEGLRGV